MANASFFLKDIEQEGYWNNLTSDEKKWVKDYLNDVKTGPADGSMDDDWYGSLRGYYAHLENLDTITNLGEKADYLKNLLIDIDAWLERKPNDYTITRVRDLIASKDF